MQKTIKLTLLAGIIMAAGLIINAGQPAQAESDISTGIIIKGKGLSTVYYLGEDNKRYVFPNVNTYFSWFDDFTNVVEIDDSDLYLYPLAGNVHYKPGALLVKIQTDPKVYAVSKNGMLRWVKNEQLARKLYGANWNLLVDDVPDSFFVNYQIDDPIESESEFDPDEEEEQTPSIGYNLGLKQQKRIVKKIMSLNTKRCQRLNGAIIKNQKRMNRWGIDISELGEDYLSQCVNAENGIGEGVGIDKVTLCHIPFGNPNAAHTIIVGKPAAKAHLAHGDTLGPCPNGEPSEDDNEEDTAPPILSNIEAIASETGAVITWTTNEAGDSEVEYATSSLSGADIVTAVIDETASTTHSIEITGLTVSTTYYFVVKSTDESDNQAVSAEMTFTTLLEEIEESDTTSPVISDVETEAQATSTTISWTTDEEADSKVYYSIGPMDTATAILDIADSAEVLSHSLELINLATSTEYYYYVESKDTADNIATGTEQTFTTLAE